MGIKIASLQAGGFNRDVLLRAPAEWDPLNPRRAWKLPAPGKGVDDAPEAFRRSLQKYLLDSGNPLAKVGLQFPVS